MEAEAQAQAPAQAGALAWANAHTIDDILPWALPARYRPSIWDRLREL